MAGATPSHPPPLRRRPGTTPPVPLDEQLPLLAATTSKLHRLGRALGTVIVLGFLSFLIGRGFHRELRSVPRVAGNHIVIGKGQTLTCILDYDDDNRIKNISRVIKSWNRLRDGQAIPPLVIYSTRALALLRKAKEYSQTMDTSWVSFVDRNLSYVGALRDCAERGSPRGSDILVVGQVGAEIQKNIYTGKVNVFDAKTCFQSLIMYYQQETEIWLHLAARQWSSAELESVAEYIESHAGNVNASAAELAENWCMQTRTARELQPPRLL